MTVEKGTVVPIRPADEARPPMAEEERSQLSDKALAKAILARDLRPRVGEVRRLAEAVLAAAKAAKGSKAKKKAGRKKAGKGSKKS